jgi:hypothetical protein
LASTQSEPIQGSLEPKQPKPVQEDPNPSYHKDIEKEPSIEATEVFHQNL